MSLTMVGATTSFLAFLAVGFFALFTLGCCCTSLSLLLVLESISMLLLGSTALDKEDSSSERGNQLFS